MEYLLFIGITLATFIIMEGVTWCTHKFVMHGFLWYLHEDHHQPKYQGIFEKNDAFFVIFAIPSIALFYFGVAPELNFKFFIGLGILLYGIMGPILMDVRYSRMTLVSSPVQLMDLVIVPTIRH